MTQTRSGRETAVDAVLRSLITGEVSAGRRARAHLAADVGMTSNAESWRGRDEVGDRITGKWPFTSVFARGFWSRPETRGDELWVTANFSHLGSAPQGYSIGFSFNDADEIVRIAEAFEFVTRPVLHESLPDHVRAHINTALINGNPISVAYVDDDGAPSLSFRGSVQVSGPNELCMWIRDAASGLTRAIAAGRPLALLYRDGATRTTFRMRGLARLAADDETRDRVFAMSPESEQFHDPQKKGAAVIISLDSFMGTTPSGPLAVTPAAS